MSGKARIGSTVIVSSGSKSDSRVLHVRLGRPLISALHEPHLAALQFQRTARSGRRIGLDPVEGVEDDHPLLDRDVVVDELALGRRACRGRRCRWAWAIGVTPSAISWRRSSGIAGSGERGDAHVSPSRRTTLFRPATSRRAREVDAAVGAAALRPLPGAPGDRLGDDQHVAQLEDEVPARVVGAPAADPDPGPAGVQAGQLGRSPRRRSASVRKIPTSDCIVDLELLVEAVRDPRRRSSPNGAASSARAAWIWTGST